MAVVAGPCHCVSGGTLSEEIGWYTMQEIEWYTIEEIGRYSYAEIRHLPQGTWARGAKGGS